ncbi:hypothetical protein COY62_02990 [bacterium (Candidatus Howlettbacteria) CG_4_10_14_0_8_um_filter_40_9]|nr:MAG: hypothetical protein COY62_02990 [bacterium (Candidatus Howlettbacteria) CG_4_10_14_0_8_um_filter_40_9]
MREIFHKISSKTSNWVGTPWAFVGALTVVIVWSTTGPIFGFSDTWQLVINTGTTIVTFLMVFLIQNTQNREAMATQLKLDELIKAIRGARNELVDVEVIPDKELENLHDEYQKIHEKYEREMEKRRSLKKKH